MHDRLDRFTWNEGDIVILDEDEDDIDWESEDPFEDFPPTEDEFVESKHPRDKGGKFATTAGGGASAKPKGEKGAKKKILAELLAKGATSAEMKKATGWPTISVPAAAKSLGLELEKFKEGGVTKYKTKPKGGESLKTEAETAEHEWDISDKKFAQNGLAHEQVSYLASQGLTPINKAMYVQVYEDANGKQYRVSSSGQWHSREKGDNDWSYGGKDIDSLVTEVGKKAGADVEGLMNDVISQMDDGLITQEEGLQKLNELKALSEGSKEAPGTEPTSTAPTLEEIQTAFASKTSAEATGLKPQLKLGDMTKLSGALGSNPGGEYIDNKTKKKYYVKFSKSPAHAKNELLAGELYSLTGARTKKYVPLDDGKSIASEWVDLAVSNAKDFTPEQRKLAQRDFATHAWLANWDAAGLTMDNQAMVEGKNKPITLDVGGALEFRAQGTPKGAAFGDKANEWDSMRDPVKNPENAKMFGDMTPEQLKESADRVGEVTDDEIDGAVKQFGGTPELAQKLKARRDDIVKRANEGVAKPEPTAAAAPAPAPAPAALAPSPVSREPSNPIGHLNFTQEMSDPAATKGNKVYKKGENKIKITPEGKWLSVSPGHGTKTGEGQEELKALLEKGTVGPSVKSAKSYFATPGASFEHWPDTAPKPPKAPKAAPAASSGGTDPDDLLASTSFTKHSPAAQKKMKELVAAAPHPTPGQKSAVQNYTSSGYTHINDTLRTGGMLQGSAVQLQDYLTSAEIPEDLTVYRKVAGQYATFLKSIIFEGSAFQDKGFSSTALTPDVWHGDLHFQISVKKGSKGAAVQHLSAHKSEMEIILPAGAKYKVIAIKGHQVELEYLGH